MSRQSRVEEYRRPDKAVSGFSRKEEDLAYWAKRAESNSGQATRAKDGPVKVPDTHERAKADRNNVGSSYMPKVRRNA